MDKVYKLVSIRDGDVMYVGQLFMDGSSREIGRFLLPNDGQWRLDVDFHDSIMDAYKTRLRKTL